MKNCSNERKDTENSHSAFLEDGINTVRQNNTNNNSPNDFPFTQSNFLKLLEENIKLRASVKELSNTLGDEVNKLKKTLFNLQKQHDENIEMLKIQAKTHREDWEAERKEKNSAESQVQIFKNQLQLLAAKFAEQEKPNKTCLCNSMALQNTSKTDPGAQPLPEKKHRKNKSPSKLLQKNIKTCNHTPSSGTDDSSSPTKFLCSAKIARSTNTDPIVIKENSREHPHRRTHSKQGFNQNKGQPIDKEGLVFSCLCDKSHESRYNGGKCKKDMTGCSSHCSEGTGAKPKTSSRGSFGKEKHDNSDAKKRARTILASALPVSPSSSGPSSPIQSPTRRHSAYLPITSTVLTSVSYGRSTISDKIVACDANEPDLMKRNNHEDVAKPNGSQRTSPIRKLSKSSCDFNDINNYVNESNHSSKTDPSNISNKSPINIALSDNIEDPLRTCKRSLSLPKVSPSDSGISCTSITVMSGSHGTSQATSSNSSRSSSPGISLMTFALNSDGKGIPGAIYFAVAADGSVSQGKSSTTACCPSPKSSSYVARYSSDHLHKNICGNELNPITDKCSSENVVNATWVRLTDKENKSSSSTWRTARAVPSNELFSNRRTSKEYADESNKSAEPIEAPFENKNFEKDRTQRVPMDQLYFTSKDLYISSSNNIREAAVTKMTSKFHPHSSKEPRLVTIDECSDSKIDLKSLASRNISSAILSYESASKTVSHNRNAKQS